jgi:hypothetical protein
MSILATLVLALAGSAYAAPAVSTRATVDGQFFLKCERRRNGLLKADFADTTVLQYALTLEHLENNFYKGALDKFDAAAFTEAGFPAWVRDRFTQIAAHEASHVAFLQTALGSAATQACEYSLSVLFMSLTLESYH